MKRHVVRAPGTDTYKLSVPQTVTELTGTPTAGTGFYMVSPNGTRYLVTVSNAGAFVLTPA